MRGTDHYDRAQAILAELERECSLAPIAPELSDLPRDEFILSDRDEYDLRVAEVHAHLAVAGALAALIAECKRGTVINVNGVETRPRPQRETAVR